MPPFAVTSDKTTDLFIYVADLIYDFYPKNGTISMKQFYFEFYFILFFIYIDLTETFRNAVETASL